MEAIMISILHPSRQRPDKSLHTLTKWLNNAKTKVEVIISLDEDDPTLGVYEMNNTDNVKIIINPNRSAVDAINNAAKAATGDIFIVVSDDTDCPQGWDQKIINATEGRTDWILKCPDGIQKWIITMPVMDRIYYNRFGYIYYPEYKHMFCDTDMTCVADLLCRRMDVHVPFPHLHYSAGKGTKDVLNERCDATWEQGEKLFIERAKQNFGIKPEDVKGQITDHGYRRWMKTKL
jgi:glycosyltransferase involved in cell wall biosynthesis